MSEPNPPFEQWHPDAKRQCGFWWDLSPIACGQCERCRKEQRGHPVMSEQMTEREWELEARRLERLRAVAPPTPQEPSEPDALYREGVRAATDSDGLPIPARPYTEGSEQDQWWSRGFGWMSAQLLRHRVEVENTRLREREARLVTALTKLRDCDWTIGRGDRMDAVRDIARAALTPDGSTR